MFATTLEIISSEMSMQNSMMKTVLLLLSKFFKEDFMQDEC